MKLQPPIDVIHDITFEHSILGEHFFNFRIPEIEEFIKGFEYYELEANEWIKKTYENQDIGFSKLHSCTIIVRKKVKCVEDYKSLIMPTTSLTYPFIYRKVENYSENFPYGILCLIYGKSYDNRQGFRRLDIDACYNIYKSTFEKYEERQAVYRNAV